MRNTVIGSFSMALLALGCTDELLIEDEQAEIIGGRTATIEQNPWQVAVISDDSFCGGVILAAHWVITAQHCVTDSPNLSVTAGVTDLNNLSQAQVRTVETVFLYPWVKTGFNGWNRDVALLRLSAPLNISGAKAKPIPLLPPIESGAVAPGKTVRVTGWGDLDAEGTVSPTALQGVSTRVMSNQAAAELWDFPVQPDEIAYNSAPGGIGSCSGDSGGPVTVLSAGVRKLAGVVSWGPELCGEAGMPDVGARITSYFDWITKRTNGAYSLALSHDKLAEGARQRVLRTINVPPGARALSVLTSGGSGDVSIYLRHGAAPSSSVYDCRSLGYSGANEPTVELCSIESPRPGTWYLDLGPAAFSGVKLRAALITP